MSKTRTFIVWGALFAVVLIPLIAAAFSPQLAWRGPVYIAAGFAGIFAMGLLLVQPLLAGGHLPGLTTQRSRRMHRTIGIVLVASVIIHVAALWMTSAPDVIDALLFASPTPFSAWGVIAMWAVFAAALLAALRKRLRLRPSIWRRSHTALALVTVVGSVVHALLIEGTMETYSKITLCVLAVLATLKVIYDLRIWATVKRRSL